MRLENTFLPADGVDRSIEFELWQTGITHWEDYDPTAVEDGPAEQIAAFIDEARDRLAAMDAGYFARRLPKESRWRCYENFRDATCFFDIETTGLDKHHHDVTTISFHQGRETTTLIKGRGLTAERIQAMFDEVPLIVTYNGRRFDIPFLETAFDIDIETPHLDAMDFCHRLGFYGGLRGAETALGIKRDDESMDGADAVRLWRQAEQGDDAALERLIRYNQEDTENLRELLDAVTDRLHSEVFID